MNGPAFEIIKGVATMRGELRRDLIAAGIVMFLILFAYIIQTWRGH